MNKMCLTAALGLWLTGFLCLAGVGCGGGGSGVDRTDYNAVAQDFLLKNPLIAHKIGKVDRVDHFGVGGDSGGKSYNVYRLSGKEKSATCNVTLERDDARNWSVTQAILNVEGTDYKVPVKRGK